MKTYVRSILLAAFAATSVFSLAAQQTTESQRHHIAQRSVNQQNRINKGVADGQITPSGAARADARQSHINAEDQRLRSKDNGHLTAQDRHKLARQQDRASQNIYDRNHNKITDPGVAPK